MDGDPTVEWLLKTEANEDDAEISPDGRWLAYDSDESGESEVYVRPFPNVGEGRWQVSTNGGRNPVWGPNGQEIFYLRDTQDGGTANDSGGHRHRANLRAGHPGIGF